MKRTAFIEFCLCLLIKESLLKTTSAENHKEHMENGSASCKCGKVDKVEIERIDERQARYWLRQEIFYPEVYGYRFKNCSVCEISFAHCKEVSIFGDYNCLNHSITFRKFKTDAYSNLSALKAAKRRHENYPMNLKVPKGIKGGNRYARSTGACHYPTTLETSALNCTIYPTSVKCRQRCAFGYTLRNGVEIVRTCNKKTNKWRPSKFKECQPFVDCGLTLVSGGAFTCTTPVVRKGPECLIKCNRYEDKKAVREKVHTCNIKGKWKPPLPFCVVNNSGLHLVPRPRNL